MQHSQKVELAMFIISCAVFLGYHVWLFWVRGQVKQHRRGRFNIWSTNRQSRAAWAVEVSATTTDALQTYTVQTLRNAITASSFLATACSLIAVTGVGNTILDSNKIARLEAIALSDPALNGGPSVFSPTTKLALTEVTVLFSFLCLTQSIRLQVHMAFYAKNIASERNHGLYIVEELVAISTRASLCFTIGLRAFYAFIPLLMWAAGPTWMLAISLLEVISLIFTDSIPLPKVMPYADAAKKKDDTERDLEKGPEQATEYGSMSKRKVSDAKDSMTGEQECPHCGCRRSSETTPVVLPGGGD